MRTPRETKAGTKADAAQHKMAECAVACIKGANAIRAKALELTKPNAAPMGMAMSK